MRRLPIRAALFAAVFVGAIAAQVATQGAPRAAAQGPACEGIPGTSSPADLHSDNVEYVTGEQGFTGGHVVVDNGILYVGSYGFGFRMYDVSDPANPVCVGDIEGSGVFAADAVPDGAIMDERRIAVLGGTGRVEGAPPPSEDINTDYTDFFDVTDPANPEHLWRMGPDQVDGEAHNADIFDEERLFLPSGGAGEQGLRIYDMNPLLLPTPAAPEILFRGDPLVLWRVSPYYDEEDDPIEDVFSHTHDISIYPDYEVEGLVGPRDIILLAEGGSYLSSEPIAAGDTGSIFVIDITDPTEPVVLHRWLHPLEEDEGEDHHPIRYHHEAQFLDSDRHVMLVTDEDLHSTPGCLRDAAGITAVGFSADLQSTVELSEAFIPPFGPPAVTCSAHVFHSDGPYVYMGSYNAGLQIFDYSDPAAPEWAGYYIAAGATSWGAYFYDGYVYVGDVSRGLDVFAFDAAASREPVPTAPPSPSPTTDPSASPSASASVPATGSPPPGGGGGTSPTLRPSVGRIPDTAGDWGGAMGVASVMLVLLAGSLAILGLTHRAQRRSRR